MQMCIVNSNFGRYSIQ